jgi:hypothetical protein
LRILLLAALALAGCATEPQPVAPPASPPQKIVRVAPLRLAVPPVTAVALDVRGPDAADLKSIEELREITRRLTNASVGVSGIALVEAVALPGFFSGSLVAGGLLLAPFAIAMNAVERRQHEAIVAALQETDLLGDTRAALEKRLPAPAAAPEVTLTVIVLAYGLVPKYGHPSGPLCLSLDADLVVRAGDRELFRDTVYLEPYRRSADAPPPVCADLAAFAAQDGAALRNAVLDYAQVLAAIARDRLPALAWTQ